MRQVVHVSKRAYLQHAVGTHGKDRWDSSLAGVGLGADRRLSTASPAVWPCGLGR